MANYPLELAQDAACQSHTGRLTGLWFLPKLAQGLNTTTTTTTIFPSCDQKYISVCPDLLVLHKCDNRF
jgi:hypothetical protein